MDLKKILDEHKKWLNGRGGARADLRGADLRGADLSGANLTKADLHGVDLRYADLSGSDLRGADLRGAYLSGADLSGADLSGADIDYTSWPLSCRGLDVHIDDNQALQLLYHTIQNALQSRNTSDDLKKALSYLVPIANKSHLISTHHREKLEEFKP